MLHGVGEALVALYGGRRAFEPHHLQHLAAAAETLGDVFSHLPPHLVIVGAHEGRELAAIGLALEHDDGDAAVVGAVYGGVDGVHLIGGHDQQVDAAGHEAVDLLYLPLVAVAGGGKAQLHVVVEIVAHAQLAVLLLAPGVLRAL